MTTPHFNQLTPAQAERLAWLLEEMGEAQHAIGKILRHGYESRNPFYRDAATNRVELERELGDVLAAIDLLAFANDVDVSLITAQRTRKRSDVQRWLHYGTDTNRRRPTS